MEKSLISSKTHLKISEDLNFIRIDSKNLTENILNHEKYILHFCFDSDREFDSSSGISFTVEFFANPNLIRLQFDANLTDNFIFRLETIKLKIFQTLKIVLSPTPI